MAGAGTDSVRQLPQAVGADCVDDENDGDKKRINSGAKKDRRAECCTRSWRHRDRIRGMDYAKHGTTSLPTLTF